MSNELPIQEVEIELAQKGAEFTPLELRLPESLPEQDWAAIGRRLLRADRVMQWWIGDWAAFGAGNPDREGWRKKGALKEFCEANGIEYGNVRNKSWVSNSVHLSLRRDTLPWSYFQEVAPMKPKEQAKWLKKAETEELSVSELRSEIRRGDAVAPVFESDGPTIKFAVKFAGDFAGDLVKWLKDRPSEFWTPERKTSWRGVLEPIVRFWEALA